MSALGLDANFNIANKGKGEYLYSSILFLICIWIVLNRRIAGEVKLHTRRFVFCLCSGENRPRSKVVAENVVCYSSFRVRVFLSFILLLSWVLVCFLSFGRCVFCCWLNRLPSFVLSAGCVLR